MVDLKCKLTDCEYNNKSNCFARHIEVNNKTDCTYYKPVKEPKESHEKTDEIVQSIVRPNVDVGCKANCIFNNNHECCANGITVMEENYNAQCSSFLPK